MDREGQSTNEALRADGRGTYTTTRLMAGLILVTEDRTPIVPSTAGRISSSGFLALMWKGEA